MDDALMLFTEAIEIVKEKPPLDHGAPIAPIQGSPSSCSPRTECAKTGDPLIDEVLDSPITQRNINYPVVDRTYDTPYGAGGSEPIEDPTTYLDRHVPLTITVPRKSDPLLFVTFDPAEPYLVHENIEQRVMEILILSGMDEAVAYKCAHFGWAEVAEGAWYDHHDIDRDAAEAQEKVYLEQILHENPEHPAPNLYVKPYPGHYVQLAQDEPYDEPVPTAEEMAQARSIVALALGIEIAKGTTGTLYVRRQLLNAERVVEWAQNEGFKTTLQPGDLHVTIAYSKAEMAWPAPEEDETVIEGGQRAVVRLGDGDCLALAFEAPTFNARHEELGRAGASWDWPSFMPHITISYDTGHLDETTLRPYLGELEFGPEIFENVKSGWHQTVTEKLDRARRVLEKAGGNPNHDEHGRFASSDSGGGEKPTWMSHDEGHALADKIDELNTNNDAVISAVNDLRDASSEAEDIANAEDDVIDGIPEDAQPFSEHPDYKNWEATNNSAGESVAAAANAARDALAAHIAELQGHLAGIDSTLAEHARVNKILKAFDENQPRDDHGRWSSGGDTGVSKEGADHVHAAIDAAHIDMQGHMDKVGDAVGEFETAKDELGDIEGELGDNEVYTEEVDQEDWEERLAAGEHDTGTKALAARQALSDMIKAAQAHLDKIDAHINDAVWNTSLSGKTSQAQSGK